jgi:hypothetical protein
MSKVTIFFPLATWMTLAVLARASASAGPRRSLLASVTELTSTACCSRNP